MAKKPTFCKDCRHYLREYPNVCPSPRMYAECAATRREEQDFVTGEVNPVYDSCRTKNTAGTCPDFKKDRRPNA